MGTLEQSLKRRCQLEGRFWIISAFEILYGGQSVNFMKYIIQGECAVSKVIFGEQSPSFTFLTFAPQIKSRLFQVVVILISRINNPADAVQFENK
ncbi:hypothetical protein SDC9_189320 [bioreactor metagenome]|uniref:Uncharacterized protein n=1 Tax=bioreactor metagenome TaxID=1076179 RepID=A0A645HRT6_9ZZZZ